MIYEQIIRTLNRLKVRYVVAGGFAVIMHGYNRTTGDLDLIVHLEKKNIALLFKAMKLSGFIPKVPVTCEQFQDKKLRVLWGKEKGMIVFSFVEREPPFNLVDIFIHEPFPFSKIWKDRVTCTAGKIKVPVLGIDQLIKLKFKAHRFVDLNDIAQLIEIKRQLHAKKNRKRC